MKKIHNINWKSDAMIYTYIIAIIVIISFLKWSYTAPIDISYKYDGIKYQIGNMNDIEKITIEINGTYRKKLFSEFSEFEGEIIVGDKIFSETPFIFNRLGMYHLEANNELFGYIFQSDEFEFLTIEIFEKHITGEGHYFDGNNGWLISAPCQTRDEAVKISNTLLRKMKGDTFTIE